MPATDPPCSLLARKAENACQAFLEILFSGYSSL